MQGLGLTSAQPIHHVPDYLPCGKASEHEWYYSAQCLYHNRRSHYFPDLPSLSGLTPGQTVGLLVTAGGELHLFLDGRHRKKIASGLPVHTPLWGAADVYGTCTKIKSEILNSKCICIHITCIWLVVCSFWYVCLGYVAVPYSDREEIMLMNYS